MSQRTIRSQLQRLNREEVKNMSDASRTQQTQTHTSSFVIIIGVDVDLSPFAATPSAIPLLKQPKHHSLRAKGKSPSIATIRLKTVNCRIAHGNYDKAKFSSCAASSSSANLA
jgi:hypothetical protein